MGVHKTGTGDVFRQTITQSVFSKNRYMGLKGPTRLIATIGTLTEFNYKRLHVFKRIYMCLWIIFICIYLFLGIFRNFLIFFVFMLFIDKYFKEIHYSPVKLSNAVE